MYKFERVAEDNYKLTYKDKEFTFRSNVKIISELQNLVVDARQDMILDLSRKGLSIKELTKEVKENGKTYYDNSNAKELEKTYQEKRLEQFLQRYLRTEPRSIYAESIS